MSGRRDEVERWLAGVADQRRPLTAWLQGADPRAPHRAALVKAERDLAQAERALQWLVLTLRRGELDAEEVRIARRKAEVDADLAGLPTP